MIVFFFKQKTAYELRISDWSSDVCSSDLGERVLERLAVLEGDVLDRLHGIEVLREADRQAGLAQLLDEAGQQLADRLPGTELQVGLLRVLSGVAHAPRVPAHLTGRSSRIATPSRTEERRVGKECVRTCRSGGEPY